MQSATMPRTSGRTNERIEPEMTRQLAPLGVVAASFYDRKHANDAIVDLLEAGIAPSAIARAFPTNADGRAATVTPQEHSWLWKFRQRHEEDLHQRGAEQMSSDGPLSQSDAETVDAEPVEIGLGEALQMFGAYSTDRIAILNHDMSPKGALLLVKCDARVREVEAILEKNAATIRTDTVTTPLEPGESDPDLDGRQPE